VSRVPTSVSNALDAPYCALHAFDAPLGDELAIEAGNAKLMAISQTKPGNRVSGTSGRASGIIEYDHLSSPQIAIATPSAPIHTRTPLARWHARRLIHYTSLHVQLLIADGARGPDQWLGIDPHVQPFDVDDPNPPSCHLYKPCMLECL
jgi:hypothetical protein